MAPHVAQCVPVAWTWERLSEVVRRLRMPAGEYAVGRVGYGLSRDRASTADRVELLVTDTGWRRLKERGWQEVGGGTALRHPREQLSARLAVLDDIRHEILEVEGLPVVALEPPPPPAPSTSWLSRAGVAMTALVLTVLVGGIAYGCALFYPDPSADTMWQHLSFRTTKVEATVESSTEISTCTGAATYDIRSPRIEVTLVWDQDGRERSDTYTGCDASTDDPQDVWVTADHEVASQSSPWANHFWPALITGIVPWAFVVSPSLDRWRAVRWRRRHA